MTSRNHRDMFRTYNGGFRNRTLKMTSTSPQNNEFKELREKMGTIKNFSDLIEGPNPFKTLSNKQTGWKGTQNPAILK